MKEIVRTIAGYSKYTYHGKPIETTRVSLSCSPLMSEEEIKIAKENQEKMLKSLIKPKL